MSRFHAHYVAFVLDTANAAFEVVILSFPTVKPITATTMNYAAPITIGVMLLAGLWYIVSAHRHYHGPRSNLGAIHDRLDENNEPVFKEKSEVQSDEEQEGVIARDL
jgi:hypothetical protein